MRRVDHHRSARLLLMLAEQEHITSRSAAVELGVSVPTVRRDLAALLDAGVRLVSTRGRGGGWRLDAPTRTALGGWTEPEVATALQVFGLGAAFTSATRTRVRSLAPEEPRAATHGVSAQLTAPNSLVTLLRATLGTNQVEVVGPHGTDRTYLRAVSSSPQMLARQLAGWAPEVEVIGPASVRRALAGIGHALTDLAPARPRT
jgi:hypothetical protein